MQVIILFRNNIKKTARVIFYMYLVFLIYILFFISSRVDTYNNINLVPFATIKLYIEYYDYFTFSNWFLNLFGNVLIFIPIGILLPVLHSSFYKLGKLLLFTSITMIFMEILQYYFRVGELDVDDVLLNTLGALIGYIILRFSRFIILKVFKNKIQIL